MIAPSTSVHASVEPEATRHLAPSSSCAFPASRTGAAAARLLPEVRPGVTPPGPTSLLGGIAADELGGCEAMERYLNERLLDPIGISTDTLLRDARGCWFGGFGMIMTTRDFARFGLLYVRGGRWDGEQILPTSWLDETRMPASTNPNYGLQFWIDSDDGYFEANGAVGQRIVINDVACTPGRADIASSTRLRVVGRATCAGATASLLTTVW